jgi:hypothetical protein
VADPAPGVSGVESISLLFSAESSRGALEARRFFFGGRGELSIAATSVVSSGAFGIAEMGEETLALRFGGIGAMEMRWERRMVALVESEIETMVRYGWMRTAVVVWTKTLFGLECSDFVGEWWRGLGKARCRLLFYSLVVLFTVVSIVLCCRRVV